MKKTRQIIQYVAAIAGVAVILAGLVFELAFRNRAYPGVVVADLEVGGLDRRQINQRILDRTEKVTELVLKFGVNEWRINLVDLGANYDSLATSEDVLSVGRRGKIGENVRDKLKALVGNYEIPPRVTYSAQKVDEVIATVASQINIPANEPEIAKDAISGGIIISAGEDGQQVNEQGLKTKIASRLNEISGEKIEIPVMEIRPKLSWDQVERIRTKAEGILGKKLNVVLPDGNQSWELTDEEILTWIEMPSGGWKQPAIKNWVEDLAKAANRPAVNATFRFVTGGKVEEFRPAKNGIEVDTEATVKLLVGALDRINSPEQTQTIEIAHKTVDPEINTGEANDLGIKELIGKGESWFSGSITNRIFNLKKAAEILNGVLVPPGETFSFNDVVGEISADTGYKQAYIIKEGKTILGDGGGVCQVSTTLFRAVLNAGLPIAARTAHAYRVSYYEVNYQVGFDATVFQPAPDFKFTNDTGGHILIQMVYDEAKKYLAFELYGTSDGRTVELSKARVWDVVAPPPDLYVDDPNLAVGKIVQTEHAARGSKVAFDWKVTRGEEVLQERTFYSNYRPWQAVYLRGTKAQ